MRSFILVMCITFGLSGCAGFSQVVAAKEQSSKIAVQAANDNIITGIIDSICGMPYGAILRHAEFIPVAKAACLPSGGTTAPDSLLPAK